MDHHPLAASLNDSAFRNLRGEPGKLGGQRSSLGQAPVEFRQPRARRSGRNQRRSLAGQEGKSGGWPPVWQRDR
jgi:hypothetical protein